MPERKSYTVREKLVVDARVQNDESEANVSPDNDVPQSTTRWWLKDEQKLRDSVDTVEATDGMRRKKARSPNDPELDKAVFTWFVKERQAYTPPYWPRSVCSRSELSQRSSR